MRTGPRSVDARLHWIGRCDREQVLPQREHAEGPRVRESSTRSEPYFATRSAAARNGRGTAARSNADGTRGRGFWRGSPAAGGSWQRDASRVFRGGSATSEAARRTGVASATESPRSPARTRRGVSSPRRASPPGEVLRWWSESGREAATASTAAASVPPGRGERAGARSPRARRRPRVRTCRVPRRSGARRGRRRSAGRPARTTGAGSPRGAKRTPRPTRRPGSKRRSPSGGKRSSRAGRGPSRRRGRPPLPRSDRHFRERRRGGADSFSLASSEAGGQRSIDAFPAATASRRPGTSTGRTPCSVFGSSL